MFLLVGNDPEIVELLQRLYVRPFLLFLECQRANIFKHALLLSILTFSVRFSSRVHAMKVELLLLSWRARASLVRRFARKNSYSNI